ncbi:MAG: cadherin-like domain-containing protein, partial [Pontiellaceae bacterium]|nr:cadherin-like domain-containing protein [Pontiellaceae bacterium]
AQRQPSTFSSRENCPTSTPACRVVLNSYTKSSYSVRIQTDDHNGGTYSKAFTITINDLTEVPSVSTDAASSITASGATLNGTVDDEGAETTITFEYGLSDSYGSSATAAQSPLGAESGSSAVSASVSGLSVATTYHYRVKAVNSVGTTVGSDQTFTTLKNTQTITFDSLTEKTYGDDAFDAVASASSGLTVSYASSDESVATVSGSTITIAGAGSCEIIASQAGNASYYAAVNVTNTLTVAKADQTITFNSLPEKVYGDAAFDAGASASSGLTVTYASSDTDVATVSGSTITIVGAGTCNITASQSGNASYNAAPDVINSFVIHDVPTVGNVSFTRTAGKPFKVRLSELLTNTSDPEGSAFDISSVDASSASGYTVSTSGSWLYMLADSSSGADSFEFSVTNIYGGASSGTVNLTVDSGEENSSYTLNLVSTETVGDAVTVTFAGIPGRTFDLQGTESLSEPISWADLGTITFDAQGRGIFTENPAPSPRYYRLKKEVAQ